MKVLEHDRLWDEPVILEAGGRVLRVQSTRDAYLCLKNHWSSSTTAGEARKAALVICEEWLLKGVAAPDVARQAFLNAALEAGYRAKSWMDGGAAS